jgi:lysozyme family protein
MADFASFADFKFADFKEAFHFTMQHEDPHLSGVVTTDAGGRTRFGIAQKFHPDLAESFFTGDLEDALALAEEMEERDYWRPMRLGEIASQIVASKLFDMGVNMGIHQAGHLAQRAANALLQGAGVPHLEEDGVIGGATVAAINSADPKQLHQMLCQLSAEFYRHVAANNPAQAANLAGWLKRAAA